MSCSGSGTPTVMGIWLSLCFFVIPDCLFNQSTIYSYRTKDAILEVGNLDPVTCITLHAVCHDLKLYL